MGSPEATRAKLGGAEIDSDPATLDRGVCTVAAPAGKRFALADVTLEAAVLPAISDALHLCLEVGGLQSWRIADLPFVFSTGRFGW